MDLALYVEWLEVLSDEVGLSRHLTVRTLRISSLGRGSHMSHVEPQPQRPRGRTLPGIPHQHCAATGKTIQEPRAGQRRTR